MRAFVPTYLVLTSALLAGAPLFAQNAASGASIVLPWAVSGIDGEPAARARALLKSSQQTLADLWLEKISQKTLATAAESAQLNLMITERGMAAGILTGTLRPNYPNAVIVQPVWCSVADHYVVAIAVSDLASDEYLAISHRSVPRETLQASRQPLNFAKAAADSLRAMQADLEQQLAQPSLARSNAEVMRVALRAGEGLTRKDLGSEQCLNLLLAERLLPKTRVLRTLNLEQSHHAQAVVAKINQGAPSKPLRANRNILLAWQPQPLRSVPPIKLARDYALQWRLVESVNGVPMQTKTDNVSIAPAAGDRLQLAVPIDLSSVLDQHQQSLARNDAPQISRIDRAWVYLDRGRAWGLSMNDRLVVKDSAGQQITGHVVGFYGANYKIKSPRGFDIAEGAIVYIRKGQRLTRLGQTLEFDPKQYPTAWPPRP